MIRFAVPLTDEISADYIYMLMQNNIGGSIVELVLGIKEFDLTNLKERENLHKKSGLREKYQVF